MCGDCGAGMVAVTPHGTASANTAASACDTVHCAGHLMSREELQQAITRINNSPSTTGLRKRTQRQPGGSSDPDVVVVVPQATPQTKRPGTPTREQGGRRSKSPVRDPPAIPIRDQPSIADWSPSRRMKADPSLAEAGPRIVPKAKKKIFPSTVTL